MEINDSELISMSNKLLDEREARADANEQREKRKIAARSRSRRTNAKLLFSNRLFKGNNLSESQKMKVIETFDRASNLREVKLVYTTLAESLTGYNPKRKRTVAEGFASKSTNSTKPNKQVIVESNQFANRMKKLAGLL